MPEESLGHQLATIINAYRAEGKPAMIEAILAHEDQATIEALLGLCVIYLCDKTVPVASTC